MAKQLNVNLAFTADTGKAKAQIQELQTLLNQIAYTGATSSSTGQLQQDLQKASSAAKELQFHLNNAFNATTGKFDLSLLDKSLKSSKSNITDLSTSLLSAGSTGQQAFLKLAQSISLADQPMLRISNRMREFGTVMKNTIKWQLSSSMIHGFMGALQSAYGYAQDLNASLNDIRIVTGSSSTEMAKFAEQANKAAKSLSTTTTDYTKASLIYFQQGLSEKEVAERTDVTIKMANAAGTSAQVVSDQMTAIWNNFDDGSKSLEYYADVLTALGAATASSTDEISQGLEKFAAVSETVGLSYEYATAALTTIMSNTRESADVVGTALKTLFARIQGLQLGETLEDGTDLNKYSQALEKVGISIYESNGELKAMDNILDEMAAKWDTLGNAEQTALAQTVAGVRQYTQLVALMENWDNGDSDSFKANMNTIAGASGTLDAQAEIYAQSWEAAEKRVRAAAEGIYQSLLDDDFFISLNNGFANVLEGIDAFIDGLGGVGPLITSIASIFISNFSHKIPQVLDDLKYNLSLLSPKGTENAYKKIQDDMTAASNKQFALYESSKGEKGIDANSSMGYAIKSANELTAARTKLALVSDRMSASEKQMAQSQLSLIEAAQQETIALKQKNEELEKNIDLSLKSMTDGIRSEEAYDKGYSKGGEVLKNIDMDTLGLNASTDLEAMGGEIAQNLGVALTQQFAKMKQEVAEGKRSIQEFTQESMKLDTIAVGGEKVSNAFKEIANKVQSLSQGGDINSIKENILSFVDILPKGVQQTEAFKKAISSIKEAKGPDELKQSFADLEKALHNTELKGKDIRKILTELHGKNITDLYNNMEQFANGTAEAEKKVTALQKMLQEFQPTHVVRMSEAFGALGGIAGNTVSIIRSVSSAAQALSNPDLSGWEKFTTVLTSVSMIVPGLMSMMRGLGTAQAFANAQVQASIASLTAEQVARITGMSVTEASIAIQNAKAAAAVREAAAEKGTVTVSQLVSMVRAKELTSTQALTIAKQLKAGATLKEAMAEAGLTAVKGGAIGAAIAHTTALVAETMAAWGLNTALAPLIAILLLFAAAVGSVILVGAGFVAALNAIKNATPEGQLRAAKEEAASLADSVKEAEQAAQDLKSAFDGYDSAVNKLKECEEGTQEWRSALHEVNGEVLDLLNKYPELASMTKNGDGTGESAIYKDPETGQLQIRDWARDRAIGQAEEAVLNTRAAQTLANQKVREAEIQVSTKDLASQLNKQNGTTATKTIEHGGESYEMDYSSTVAKYIAEHATEFQGLTTEEQKAKLTEQFGDMDLNLDGWISAIQNLSGPMNSLVASIDANTAAIQYENEAIVDSALADSEKVQDSQYGDLITEKIASTDYQAEVAAQRAALEAEGWGTNGINKATGVNDQARTVFAEYAKAAGITDYDLTDTTGTDANRNFVYTDANGQEITVSLDKMLDVVANQRAQEQIQIDAEGLADQLAQHEVTGKDKETVDSLLKSGLAGLTEEQRKAVEESGDIGSILSDEAMASMEAAFNVLYGDEGAAKLQAWLESLNQQIANWQPEQFDTEAWKTEYASKMDVANDIEYGETISAEDYALLGDEYAQYFQEQLDGTYKLVVAADVLRNAINQIETEKLEDTINNSQDTINNTVDTVERTTGGIWKNASDIDRTVNAWEDTGVLTNESQAQGVLNTSFAQGLAEGLDIDLSQYDTAVEKVNALRDAWNETNQTLDETQSAMAKTATNMTDLDLLYDKGLISSEDYGNSLINLAANYSECQDDIAEYQRVLNDSNSTTEDVQKAQKKLAKAIENAEWRKVTKNIKNYLDELEDVVEGSEEMYEIYEDMAGAINDAFGTDVGTEFIEDNIDLIKKWSEATGDEATELAMQIRDKARMASTAFTDIFGDAQTVKLNVDGSQAQSEIVSVQTAWDRMKAIVEANPATMVMGVEGRADLSAMISAMLEAGFTAQQVANMVASLGYSHLEITGDGSSLAVGDLTTPEGIAAFADSLANWSAGMQVTGEAPSGGVADMSNVGGGGGGGGGGGSDSEEEPETVDRVKHTDIVDRYREIDNSIDDLTEAMEDATEVADRLYGADRIKAMEKVNNLLEQEIALNKQKIHEAQHYLKEDKQEVDSAAAAMGVKFTYDEKGNITNYTEVMNKLYRELNQAIDNANADGDADDDEQEAIDDIQERIDDIKEAVEQYDETKDLIEDLNNDIEEALYEIYDNELEMIQYQFELDLQIQEDDMSVLEYQLSRIEDDAFSAAEQIALINQQMENLYDQANTNKAALEEIFGLSASQISIELFGNDETLTEEQAEAIRDYRDSLLEINEQYDELRATIEDKVLEVYDAWNEKLETSMDNMEHYSSVLESYKNIVDIVGQTTLGLSDTFMAGLEEKVFDNAIDNMKATQAAYDTMMKTKEEAEAALAEAKANGDEKSAKMWEETLVELNSNMQEAQEDFLSSWEDALDLLSEQFEASVERVINAFNEAVYAHGGLEGLSEEFNRQKEMTDVMVDDYQKIYELSKLNRNIQQTIDDTEVIAGKQKLKKLQSEINKLTEDGVELSHYDLEYLQAEYELRMAEIELENAQAKKDTVRLSKDNEGNWSYVYTTSTDAVDAAQQKYEDALYAMQELSSNYIDEMSEQLISTSQDMAEALAEVQAEDFANEEDYKAELDRIRKQYEEMMAQQQAELNKAIDNNDILYNKDMLAYEQATNGKYAAADNFATAFKDTLLGTLMDSESLTANFNEIMRSSVDILTDGLVQAASTYYTHLSQAMEAAGTSTDTFADDMGENIEEVSKQSEEGAKAVEDMGARMAKAFEDITKEVTSWQETYGLAMEDIIQSNLDVIDSFNTMLKELSVDPDAIHVSYDIKTDYGIEDAASMDTGGYTGEWGNTGKLAVLHEKEMVLNADDTLKLLEAMNISRVILETIELNARQASAGMGQLRAISVTEDKSETLEQNVHITAEFPSVSDHNEIEEAMKNLINTASQYANRK